MGDVTPEREDDTMAVIESSYGDLLIDRDSWRRVGERLEGEKVAALAEVERLQGEVKTQNGWAHDQLREVERLREDLAAMTKARDNWHRKYGEMREVAKRNG